jgi:hypothetical protein
MSTDDFHARAFPAVHVCRREVDLYVDVFGAALWRIGRRRPPGQDVVPVG